MRKDPVPQHFDFWTIYPNCQNQTHAYGLISRTMSHLFTQRRILLTYITWWSWLSVLVIWWAVPVTTHLNVTLPFFSLYSFWVVLRIVVPNAILSLQCFWWNSRNHCPSKCLSIREVFLLWSICLIDRCLSLPLSSMVIAYLRYIKTPTQAQPNPIQ